LIVAGECDVQPSETATIATASGGTVGGPQGTGFVAVQYPDPHGVDGNYELRIDAAKVTTGGEPLNGGDTGAGSDYVDAFFRHFGDSDGDRDVDGQDYGRFGLLFLKSLSTP
jgi:hypothetical protein